MLRAHSIDEFLADPIGHCHVGATYVVWCASEKLCGSTHWGKPSERDMGEVTRLFDVARHPSLRSFDVYMDCSAVETVGLGPLALLSEYVKSRLPEWGPRIRKQAVVTPSGILAVVLAGVVPLLGPTYPLRFFSASGAAVEWLAADENLAILDELQKLVAEVQALVAEVRGVPPVVRELRDYLHSALEEATVETAARALRRSSRSLQRELRQASTSFVVELTRARVNGACALLAHSDEKVEEIARRVGALTSSRLGVLFRRELGETPLAYRARHRRV